MPLEQRNINLLAYLLTYLGDRSAPGTEISPVLLWHWCKRCSSE